mmetsp:Transcript_38137/g.82950  ORF Transcript_38137/g.82950 Transcript_38137/m.82950 type:complete len:212 (-) Transcript_38137:1128-1763(-)
MQSYMIPFHASPVTHRKSVSIAHPKFEKLACRLRNVWFRLTLPKRFTPRMAYTKNTSNSSAPTLISVGSELSSVSKSVRKASVSLTTRSTRVMRRRRRKEVFRDIKESTTMIKSAVFQRDRKYSLMPKPSSLNTASAAKIHLKISFAISCPSVHTWLWPSCTVVMTSALSRIATMMPFSNQGLVTKAYILRRHGISCSTDLMGRRCRYSSM